MTATSAQGTEDRVEAATSVPPPISGCLWGILRLSIGWIFLWSFLDKLLGLGFATCRGEDGVIDFACSASFVKGGAPTYGFLEFATQSSHTGGVFRDLAPSGPTSPNVVDWLFMVALLLIGVALMLGIGVRLAGFGGALLVAFMYLAGFVWPENNPVIDEHIIEIILLVSFALVGAGRWLGFGNRWARTKLVQSHPVLL